MTTTWANRCLHEIFEEQVRRTPDAVAVTFEQEQCTYAQLNARANLMAHQLRALGAGPEVLVGICLERSIDMMVGILAILKAGAAYIPLDPAYPSERLSLLLEDSRAPLVLTHSALTSRLPGSNSQLVCIDRDLPPTGDTQDPVSRASPENVAYVIYTSGSTGVPKGVLVEHRHVVRLFESTWPWFRFDSSEVWTLFHSFGFDFSVWEMWGALLYGGRLVVVPSEVTRAPDLFHDLLVRERVTVLNQTPSAFHQLSRVEEMGRKQAPLSLRWIIFGGEALDPQMLRSWMDRHGDEHPRLINMYGITETTVHVTYRPITHADLHRVGGSPIGRPIPDLSVYLLDEQGQEVPSGTPGEIYVGGAGVARGYLRRPELNEQRFIPDPFRAEPGARMYRSGDLAIRGEEGDLVYVGRGDAQLKIRGFRIEPGEVESCLRRHPGVSEVVVLGRDYGHGDRRLVAYFVPTSAWSENGEALRNELQSMVSRHLPEHMRPSTYVVLDKMPLNTNGKVDRNALPAPEQVQAIPATSTPYEMSPLERTLTELWTEVLGVKSVGPDDDFFELGGTSLGAINLLLLIQERLGHTLDMSIWADGATLGYFAEVLSKQPVSSQFAG
jgi:fengycin family lipopeptide synthetase B